jgi:hypothetical protein
MIKEKGLIYNRAFFSLKRRACVTVHHLSLDSLQSLKQQQQQQQQQDQQSNIKTDMGCLLGSPVFWSKNFWANDICVEYC